MKKNILFINVGSTNTQIAFFEDEIIHNLILEEYKTLEFSIEYKRIIKNFVDKYSFELEKVFVSSVRQNVSKTLKNFFGSKIIFLSNETQNCVSLDCLYNQYEIGADILAQIYYATSFFNDSIIVSMGTITTISFLKENRLEGCIFLPGISMSEQQMYSSTDLQPTNINLIDCKKNPLGKNTSEAIALGLISSIELHIENIKKTYKSNKYSIIISGGDTNYFNNKDWWKIPNIEILGLYIFAKKTNN